MCELMGLSFAQPISAGFSIHEFALRSQDNADGWGLAWYPDQSVALIKEPLQWRASGTTRFLEKYEGLNARTYIAHVRHRTTGGPPTHADTHPFTRELGGVDYCFAHNGTLAGPFCDAPLHRYRPVGKTDSELMFCYILEELAQAKGNLASDESWRWLERKLTELNRWGKLNCLVSDGVRLCAYHDAAGHKGLHLRKVAVHDPAIRRFEDSGMQIDLAGDPVNHGYVIATRPLSSTGWRSFVPGELLVLEHGTVRYSSRAGAAPASVARDAAPVQS
jgi:glutamine amidotransferase